MRDINMPAPLALAGAALCVLGGYLVGVVAGPDPGSRTTAVVASFERGSDQLCLTGDAVAEAPEADEDGVLCGTWRHGTESRAPREGDTFRFVVITSDGGADVESATYIYGDVVG
jgi:hypothetical protein